MSSKIRVGAVSYLNTRPLIFGFEQGLGADRVELTSHVPSRLSHLMAAGEIDVGLLPVIELARIPGLEILPGLGIVSRGPARSVLLVCKRPPDQARSVALDPHSRTSNALTRILFEEAWEARPEFRAGHVDLDSSLRENDAVVRIGDKALFEPVPEGATAIDLGDVWDRRIGAPFVYAVWACRPGVLDRELYRMFHESRRRGMKAVDLIAEGYTWNGRQYPEVCREYLTRNIHYRLGGAEIDAVQLFLRKAARVGVIPREPHLRLGLTRWTACHETAAARGTASKPAPSGRR